LNARSKDIKGLDAMTPYIFFEIYFWNTKVIYLQMGAIYWLLSTLPLGTIYSKS
jgi:hypothetical protein